MSTINLKLKEHKKSIALITIGIVNVLHATLHIAQFIQSVFLISASVEHHHEESQGFFETMSHSIVLNVIWGIIGIFTLYLGVKDFIHHRKCDHKHDK